MVENMMDDGVELKSAIIEAYVKAFVDVKHVIEGSVDFKISIQASFEAKPIGVSKLRAYEVNTASLF